MRNIPGLPLYLVLPDNRWEVGQVGLVPAFTPDSERFLFRRLQAAAAFGFSGTVEKSHVERRVHGERRNYCRRIEQARNKLLDTRAEKERRHYNRRHGDVRTNIEEDV
ncbi:hypothetical protein SKTS_09930 [Sulfurimicrobium lacus]|uniref:Uncharacterized protein n=1 Tax=Sulfurimicrobium lacus TaxID=2715678 RepID=A0A6F8VAH0_9PROT|nr:hypothetical protein SKTS_09930 [Sulfurimicrobium lacus]